MFVPVECCHRFSSAFLLSFSLVVVSVEFCGWSVFRFAFMTSLCSLFMSICPVASASLQCRNKALLMITWSSCLNCLVVCYVGLCSEYVSSDVFGVDCSDLRVEVSADQHVCVCVRLLAPVSVLLELGIH